MYKRARGQKGGKKGGRSARSLLRKEFSREVPGARLEISAERRFFVGAPVTSSANYKPNKTSALAIIAFYRVEREGRGGGKKKARALRSRPDISHLPASPFLRLARICLRQRTTRDNIVSLARSAPSHSRSRTGTAPSRFFEIRFDFLPSRLRDY